MGFLTKNKYKPIKKPSCPFGRQCFSDSSVCGFIGYYADCPEKPTEDREDVHKELTPHDLLRR